MCRVAGEGASVGVCRNGRPRADRRKRSVALTTLVHNRGNLINHSLFFFNNITTQEPIGIVYMVLQASNYIIFDVVS